MQENTKIRQKKYEIDMVHGPLAKKILLFALPLMLSSMMQLLFNAADVIVVGRFAGSESLAAVGSTTSLINLITNLFVGLSIGANVVVANAYGAGRTEEIKETLHTAMILAMVSGVIVLVVGVLFAPDFLLMMASPENVIDLASVYLRIYFLGMPALMIYNFGAAMLRAIGDTKRPLYYLLFAGVVNVGLNMVLVICFRLGVVGVAVATAVSQYISAGLILWCLIREKGCLHFEFRALRLDVGKMVRIMKIGLPAGLQGIVFSLSNVVIQATINSFGAVIMAGSAAAANIEGFIFMAMNAFHQTAITFSGQNYGAGELKRVDKVFGLCVAFVGVTGLGLGLLAVYFAAPLLGIYSGDPMVIEAGIVRLTYVCALYALCGIMDVCVGILRGMNRAVIPMIVSIVGACGLRLLWIATVFQHVQKIEVLYIAYPVTWAITLSVHLVCILIVRRREGRKHYV